MREVINISLPVDMAGLIRRETKIGGYASVSEYMRHLIRLQLADRFANDRRAIMAGKGKKLISLKNLR